MSAPTIAPVVTLSPREERLARQGEQAAARTLADLRATGLTGEDAVTFLTDAADRVEQGPAPEPFKRGYADAIDHALVPEPS
ncbi:hypothetical protein [Nocardioides pakistanensis]